MSVVEDAVAASIAATAEPVLSERIVLEIVEVLQVAMTQSFRVEPFPARPSEFDLGDWAGAALVMYQQTDWTSPATADASVQVRTLEFGVIVLVRGLDGAAGSYRALDTAGRAVAGRRYAGCLPAELVRERLEEERDGVWRWRLDIRMRTATAIAVPRLPPMLTAIPRR